MATDRLTRRTMLGAIAAVPAIALAPAAALASTTDRTAWDKLVAAYRAAEAEHMAAVTIEDERTGEYYQRRPGAPAEPAFGRITDDMTLAEIKAMPKEGWDEYEQAKAAWKAHREELREQIVGEAERACRKACERSSAALSALCAYPSPTLSLLAEKVGMLAAIFRDDETALGHAMSDVIADVRRLAEREA